MSITIFFSPSNFYFLAFPGSYTCPKSYGHHFPVRRNTFKRQGFHVACFRSFSIWPLLVREGYHCLGMSIFLLFLRRLWIALDANSHTVLKQCVASNRYARKICENFSKCLGSGIPLGRVAVMRKTPTFLQTIQVWSIFICTFLLSGTPFNKRRSQQSRTANLHRTIAFWNQSADFSSSTGRPLADFRRLSEQSDCFENTVWAQGASLFEKQSIGGAARQENQQVDCGRGEIALDVENLPCANGCSETPKPNLAVWECYIDRENGAPTTRG